MKTLRVLALGLLGTLCVWVAPSCSSSGTITTPCTPSACAGCCGADNLCHPRDDGGACPVGASATGSGTGSTTASSATTTTGTTRGSTTGTTASTTTNSTTTGTTSTTASTTTGTTTAGTTGSGPLTCTAPASYNTNNGGSCGTFRWAVKTGTDGAAGSISLNPTPTTIGQLAAIPAPAGVNTGSSSRLDAAENTVYILRNVTLIKTKLEPDSDYHLPITDGTASMETEIPFPNTCTQGSPWTCEITHARAALEKVVTPGGSYVSVNQPVTIIGVGFFDTIHGSASQAPNGIELHPILAMCVGQDCDPYAN